MASFKIGINMAGAISAGAYTAGVLDFLIEALDAWYKAKHTGEAVPGHDVMIEVFSGASAGGMCAAISAVMLQDKFDHIHDTRLRGTNNRFYEAWVNEIDIRELLKTDDLRHAPPVVSLLDSTIIGKIAADTLTPGPALPPPREYVSPNLTLFLSLTNLLGTPYSLNGAAPGSIEETTFFYGDRIRFETRRADTIKPPAPSAHVIDLSKQGAEGGWDVLQTAAMATGAFPIFLAPRILGRYCDEYTPPMWESVASALTGTPPPIAPDFPPHLSQPFSTVNVDGGVTNNDPFNYAHDYLTSLDPLPGPDRDPHGPVGADRAVISIAPFPTTDRFQPCVHPRNSLDIFSVLPRLFSALISQSRFFGESLNQVMSGTTYSRFIIAPSDDHLVQRYRGKAGTPSRQRQPPALQCAALGAFGGFFERGFRAHDYALGRRNCQKFLVDYFVLPEDNVVINPSLDALDATTREAVLSSYARPAPGTYAESAEALKQKGSQLPDVQAKAAERWLPIIPLCTKALTDPIPAVPRALMEDSELNKIVSLILKRFRAVMSPLLTRVPSPPLRFFLQIGQPFIAILARGPLKDALVQRLGDSYKA